MARIFQTGFEVNINSTVEGPDGLCSATGVALSTATKYTGASSLSLSGVVGCYAICTLPSAVVAGSVGFWLSKSGGVLNSNWFELRDASNNVLLRFQSTFGYLQMVTPAGTSLAAAILTASEFTHWAITFDFSGTGGNASAYLYKNGFYAGGGSWTQAATSVSNVRMVTTGITDVQYWDDLCVNDTSGSTNNGVVTPDQAVYLLYPTADSQDGSWTIASGGNTNIFDAVNNLPVNATSPSAASDGNRIESVDSSGNNSTDELRVSLLTPASAGVPSTKSVSAWLPFLLAGEEAATGTKSASFGFYENPAGSLNAVADVTAGVSGAVATYPTQWFWFRGSVIESTQVDLSLVPVMNLRKTDTTTRSLTVGFLGAYVSVKNTPSPNYFNPAAQMMPLLCM